jgi:hypothetical protein
MTGDESGTGMVAQQRTVERVARRSNLRQGPGTLLKDSFRRPCSCLESQYATLLILLLIKCIH